MAHETVLIVEDDDSLRDIARAVLERLGYKVLAARDGQQALELARSHPDTIHLVLTDVVMPKMSGREVAKEVTSVHPEAKVLYMSGYTDDSIVHHGVLDAGVHFLEKPITPATLAKKAREVLDGKSGT